MKKRPKLRSVNIFPVELSGKRFLYFRDPLSYAKEIAVPIELIDILRLFDGDHTFEDIQLKLLLSSNARVSLDFIADLALTFDECLLLESEQFHSVRSLAEKDFLDSPIRRAKHAGVSYPADSKALEQKLDSFFAEGSGLPNFTAKADSPKVKAIISPHMDLRCAGTCYSWAYKELAEKSPEIDTIVILGTSHYGCTNLFSVTDKNFETPLGTVETNKEFVSTLREELGETIDDNDYAHKLEHSIEFQTIFIKYLFNKTPKIVPILVNSFHQMMYKCDKPEEDQEFQHFTKALSKVADEWKGNVAFVLGVDLSHIGKKFGDSFAAQSCLSILQQEDLQLISHIENSSSQSFFESIKSVEDRNRICGFSPILTYLSMITSNNISSKLLKYEQWNELPTESAVTYASLAFYEN